ncbi:hypothetical protein AYK20_00185 [Thermoplasmatales archaeon SG8-52-1]|nr:MAG: hypothetical protein AYK20_00185 [Thermoplasmatales archaeon SG8-52-1]
MPFVFLISILLAMINSPWFIWTNNALSDMGAEGISAFFFNTGLIFAGLLAFIFSIGVIKILTIRIGGYIIAISSLSLIGVGIFPITIFDLHYIASAIFFISLTIGLLILGLTMKQYDFDKSMGNVAIVFAFIAFISPVSLYFFSGIAIPEIIICFFVFLWYMIYGVKITRSPI